jgi:hypothetical protein
VPGANDVPGRLRQPDSPTPANHIHDLERLAASDRDPTERWSRAELRDRLERLPPGHPSSARTDAPEPDERPDAEADAPERNYWSEVPRFQRAWADHQRRWPAEQRALTDPTRHLTPDQHEQAEKVLAGVRQTEERLTKRIEETGRDNAGGAWLEGLEFRLKGEGRLKEKIAGLLETGAPDATAEEIAHRIPDAIRYTFCARPENYKDACWDIKSRLEGCGYVMYYSENHWPDTQYKGINTRWITPEGQRFEVQFHTPESFHAKQAVTHASYERLRNALTTDGERRELRAFQQQACSWIATPEGADDIPSYREKGH